MSGIEGKKGYYLQKTGARVNELLERHYIVPTFTTSPTEDTLSWDDDGHIVYFRIGEIIRVKTSEGYDFYRVNDIKDNKINWAKIDTPSDTYTKDEIDVKFFTKVDASGYISEKLVNYYSKREVDGKIEQTNKSVLEQTERVDNLGVELKNKASAEQVNKLESGLETTKRSIAEQTTKVTALQSEIKTKASTQSVTQLGDSVNIISDTVAEQTIRTDELEASIETKVSQEVFDATTGDINSEFIAVKQTTDAIETAVKAQSGEITAISESVNGLSISLGTIESDLDSLRNQMDGTTESYFEKWIPTNENEPAKTWIEQGKQAEHKGDTFTNISLDGEDAGKSWRWLQDDNGNWGWQPIADTDALKALEAAAKAQAAADGKVTIYYEQPSNYKEGDIWFVHNNSYSPYKQGEILSAKTENTLFSISDWESKTRYTQAVEDLNNVMITSFKDGVLTEAERISIIESITSIANEQAAVQARYNIIIINANLTDETLKNEFKATKVAYDTACTSLINIVEQIADAKEENLESLFDSYTQLSDDYSEAYADHNEKESEINNALMGRLNPANVYIDNITDDGILTPIEKEQLFEIYRSIAREYDATRSNAFNYKVWKYSNDGVTEESGLNGGERRYESYVAFKNAYTAIANVFSSSMWGFTKMDESTTLPEGYTTTLLKSYLDTYYEAYGILTESFSAITAAIEAAQKATEATLKGLTDNLLPEEMTTTVGKGVVLSTIIATKDVNGNITAGMNASSAHYNPEHGRVVFVGGAKDISDFNNAPYVVYEDGHVKMESADIAAYASRVEMYTSLASKADISSFNEIVDAVNILKNMWRFEDVGGTLVLKSEYDVITNGQFAAAAVGAEGGGSVGATYLSDLYDVSLGSLLSGDLLSWNGSEWVNIKQSSLVPDLSAYASKSFVSDALEGYLPKSGGILRDSWSGGTEIRRSDSNNGYASLIFSQSDGTILGRFGFGGVDNPLFITQSGAYNTLIHSGNIGSQSVAYASNAGTLSGVSLSNGSNTPWGTIPMITEYGWMDVGRQLEFHYDNTTGSDYSTVLRCAGNCGNSVFLPSASGTLALTTDNVASADYATSAGSADTLIKTYYDDINFGYGDGVKMISNPSSGTGNYPSGYQGGLSVMTQYGGWQMTSYGGGIENPYFRSLQDNGVWKPWKQLAFLDDNVASATKLETPRTIWGQSFDGTGDVSGNLTLGNNIKIMGKDTSGSSLSLLELGNDNNVYFAYGTRTLPTQIFGTPIKFKVGDYTKMLINSSGNVTIGESDWASSVARLFVQGKFVAHSVRTNEIRLGDSIEDTSSYLNNWYYASIGYEYTDQSPQTLKPDIVFKTMYQTYAENSGEERMRIKANGNVLIGSTTDNGAKVSIVSTSAKTLALYRTTTGGGSFIDYFANNETENQWRVGHNYGSDGSSFVFNKFNGTTESTLVSIKENGNVLIGTTTDRGYKLDVNGNIGTSGEVYLKYNKAIRMRGNDDTDYNALFTLGTDLQIGYDSPVINIGNSKMLINSSGNVGIGTPNPQYALDVIGNVRATVFRLYGYNMAGLFPNHYITSAGYSSDMWLYNEDRLMIYGSEISLTSYVKAYSNVDIIGSLVVQSGITTNEITIGGIKLDVYGGALRVNGDIFSTGQFAASVAGEATGGSNIVLDYASIVNALGYTPANNNNLAQVAFTGSYSSLSGTPDVYTKADVYNKNEINQKLAGVGGGGGSVGSTFGIDYINGQSFDMPNGVNCITSYSEATVNFSSVVPADPSLPCIVYIVKCDYHTLQVTSGCNIISVNSSGDEVIDFSINGMTGMMLVWEPDYWRWFAYLQK